MYVPLVAGREVYELPLESRMVIDAMDKEFPSYSSDTLAVGSVYEPAGPESEEPMVVPFLVSVIVGELKEEELVETLKV